MGFKPSSRRAYGIDEPDLNIIPAIGLFGVLVAAMVVLTSSTPTGAIQVAAPSVGSPGNPGEKAPDKPPLNLTLAITDTGYKISSQLPGAFAEIPGLVGANLMVPLLQKEVLCGRYRGTTPPPRKKNESSPACKKEEGMKKKTFWVYDTESLSKKMLEIKNRFPQESRIIIASGPDVEYESIIDAMDATRDILITAGDLQILFDEVVMSPGL